MVFFDLFCLVVLAQSHTSIQRKSYLLKILKDEQFNNIFSICLYDSHHRRGKFSANEIVNYKVHVV